MNFNNQAESYDKRINIPPFLSEIIAQKLMELIPSSKSINLLEVGVGTGEISFEIAKLPVNYIGFDKSTSMVDIFLERYSDNETTKPKIVVADGNKQWPVDDKSIDVLFGSKALHLLDSKHLLNEINRIKSAQGLTLIIGNVKKDPLGIDFQMRKTMQKMLLEYGIIGKGGKKQREKLYEQCVSCGAELLAPVAVAKWDVNLSANDSINAWRKVEGLAGHQIDDKIKLEIINNLEDWAVEKIGSLSKQIQSYRQYNLSGVFIKNTVELVEN